LPQYYQKHRGLNYFNPASYSVWKKPVAGWCSWFAYYDKITEADIRKTADVLSEKLKPFGLDYLQIDDGYQQTPIGMPDTWLTPNKKFPSGLNDLAEYISEKGLSPGIWTNVSFADSAAAFQNKNLFVQNRNKQPAFGNWVGYIMDGSNPAMINKLISPVYSGLVKDGWHYFKLDALRHLNYEGYNSYKNFFDSKH
jgi:alpha-galactosidase